MGFMNEPTAADYAWSDARDAKEKNKDLEVRVEALEKQVASLIAASRPKEKTAAFTDGRITYWSEGSATQTNAGWR